MCLIFKIFNACFCQHTGVMEEVKWGLKIVRVCCVAVQGEDIYCRIPNITDACQPVWGSLLTDSSDSDEVKTHTHMHVTHLCSHLLALHTHTHALFYAHTHTHTQAAVHTFTVLIRTKNWNTNTNNTTIKTLFCFRNPYSYVLYSVERQLSFNKWTWFFFCLSLKWSVRYHPNEKLLQYLYIYVIFSLLSPTDPASWPLFTECLIN